MRLGFMWGVLEAKGDEKSILRGTHNYVLPKPRKHTSRGPHGRATTATKVLATLSRTSALTLSAHPTRQSRPTTRVCEEQSRAKPGSVS